MAALFLGRRKDIKKAASGPITEQVSGEQHNCCSVIGNLQNLKKLQNIFYDGTMRALSKADLKPSRANMHGAASLWKEKQTLSLPPTCTQLVLCEKGKFALDGEFSKNAPYKQKIIFHLTSIGKMSRKIFFLPWTVGRWYLKRFAGNNQFSEGRFSV